MKSNIITMKIKYNTTETNKTLILSYIKNYNNVLRFTYNRIQEGIKETKDLTEKQKVMNNIFVDSHFKNSAIYEAKAFNEKKTIFGGKNLFVERCQNKISKEDFAIKKLMPLYSVGEANQRGNRKFLILDNTKILFKPNRSDRSELNLESVGKNYKKVLNKLIELQKIKKIAITYKLDLDYIYISFDNTLLKQSYYKTKKDRIFAIDLNPNYLGYSIVDWKDEMEYKIIDSGVYDISLISRKYNSIKGSSNVPRKIKINHKRDYEIVEIAHQLFELCKHYKCEVFSIEDLSIKVEDTKKGKKLNRMINNQWNRNLMINVIKKLVNASSTRLIEVKPEYSSILGNVIYRIEKLPDMVLSSIEIGRRGYEFNNQYLLKIKAHSKVIICPNLELVKERISMSLEELGIQSQFGDYKTLFSVLKKLKNKYRFLLDLVDKSRVLSKFYKKRMIILYKYV